MRDSASAVLRRLWVTPQAAPERFEVPKDKIDALARLTLDTMLVRAFRVTPLPPEDEYAELLARVRHWVERGQPVRIMLGYAPMKNPKTASHAHADWADQNPELVKKLYTTYRQATDWLQKNPDAAAPLMFPKAAPDDQKQIAALIRANNRLGISLGGANEMRKEIEGTKFQIKGTATKGDSATLKVLRQKGDESDTGEIAFVRENGEWKMLPPQ